MHVDNAKLIQITLISVSLVLSACDVGSGSAPATATATPAPAPVITSLGTDFYLTLPDNLCVSNPATCNNRPVTNKLIVAASAATTGEVTFNGVITPFSVAAGSETVITLDPAVVLITNETVEAKAIHVTALSPVAVHVVSESATSADGYLALPTPSLGTKYYVMSYASSANSKYSGSEFAVVATQNATTVSITPAAAGATKQAGIAFTVLLNSGETYQLINPTNADLTGTLVTADKPVAVFSGHRCGEVPLSIGYCDYLVEQLPDVSIWGKTHHTARFTGRANYMVRVVASLDGTTFTTTPAGLIGTLNAGQHVDVKMASVGEFIANNPVLVAQFMLGYGDDAAGKGDPSMVVVTPVEQGMTDSIFGVHGLAGTTGAFMNVVTETTGLASLKLDNAPVNSALFTPVGGTSIYSVGTIPVAPGAHTLLGTVPYSALVYDYGIYSNAVSYAYPVAAKLSSAVPASQTPGVQPPATCSDDRETEGNHSPGGHHHNHSGHHSEDEHDDEHDDDCRE